MFSLLRTPDANDKTIAQKYFVKELYVNGYDSTSNFVLELVRRNRTSDNMWAIAIGFQDNTNVIYFVRTSENPEGNGIAMYKSDNGSYIVVDWTVLPEHCDYTYQVSDEYLLRNDIIYSLDANPTISAAILKDKVEAKQAEVDTLTNKMFSLLYHYSSLDDFKEKTGWTIDNGGFVNSESTGFEKWLLSEKKMNLNIVSYAVDVELPSDEAKLYFGFFHQDTSAGSGNSLWAVSMSEQVLEFYGGFSRKEEPSTPVHKISFITESAVRNIRLHLSLNNRAILVKVINLNTGSLIVSAKYGRDGEGTYKNIGYDRLFVYSNTLNTKITKLETFCRYPANPKNCFSIIYGDSITYGWQCEVEETWSHKLADYLQNTLVFGEPSGTISGTLAGIDTVAAIKRPTIIFVCIGTNGGNTESNLQELVDKCNEIGARLILCTTPEFDIGISDTNSLIIKVAALNNIDVVRFDIATSIDYDISKGKDSSLFASTLHPNAAGQSRMFDRVFVDCPYLM